MSGEISGDRGSSVLQIHTDKHFDIARVQNQLFRAPGPGAGRQAQIETAGNEDGGAEGCQAVPVPQAQQGDGSQIGACAVSANGEPSQPEFLRCLPDEPERCGFAVIRRCRIGVLGASR